MGFSHLHKAPPPHAVFPGPAKVHSCADLNRIIQDIDHTFRTGTLLPRSEVEGMLSQKYKLSDNTKNTLSEN